MLYLFCGKPRKADVKHYLQEFGLEHEFSLHVTEVDVERQASDDLLNSQLWDKIFQELEAGLWDVVVMSPPCNTFSRVRFNWKTSPGPRPLRNFHWPRGFPWLTGSNLQLAQDHNYLVDQTIATAHKCFQCNADFLIEHPEDLGACHGEWPASVWQWETMQQLQQATKATTWAVFQCHFDAPSPKPTRFLSTLKPCQELPYATWPVFDKERQYLGPLPTYCGHSTHAKRLLGQLPNGKWATEGSAAYPPALCKYLAELIASRVGSASASSLGLPTGPLTEAKPTTTTTTVAAGPTLTVATDSLDQPGDSDTDTQRPEVGEDEQRTREGPEEARNRGKPLVVEWGGRAKPFVDGFGLCSANRWRPEDRGTYLGMEAQQMGRKLKELLQEFVMSQIGDLRKEAFHLALGRLQSSPFSESALQQLRERWAQLLPSPASAMELTEGQPFFLHLLAQTLEVMEDPDYRVLVQDEESFATGVPVGLDEPLPRVPAVFPPKEKQRKLDDSDYIPFSENYKSAELVAEELENKFREEERLGRMYPTTLAALKAKHPDREVLVASMGAIQKPNGDIRPIHDATHHVQLNNRIVFRDQLQYPGPEDAAGVIREVTETKEARFSISADIKSAHRLVKLRSRDHPLICCKASSTSDTIWVNKVGTFGVSSASYWWTRLMGTVGRLVGNAMGTECNYQLIYVDDLHVVVFGERKFLTLWMMLAAYEALGTPFQYAKFAGGIEVTFVGFQLDYGRCKMGVTAKRGLWLLNFIKEMEEARYTVHMRRFGEFLGRLAFLARVLVWLKAHLAPLYSWAAALAKGTVATAPRMVVLVLKFIFRQLADCSFMYSCHRPIRLLGEQFRTDAKCAQGFVVLGVHHLATGRWFSLRLDPEQAPYLFKPDGESSWASAPAELLATTVALVLFNYGEGRERMTVPVYLAAGTDNQSNEALLQKGSSTKFPLALINMQLTHMLMRWGMRLELRWRPRAENDLADKLTNEDFSQVEMRLRLECKWEDFDFSLLRELWEARHEFMDKDTLRKFAKHVGSAKFEKTQW